MKKYITVIYHYLSKIDKRLWIVLLLSQMFLFAFLSMLNDSATVDERAHIAASYTYITQHDYRLNPEHPPLLKDISGLSLELANRVLGLKLYFPTDSSQWIEGVNEQWDLGYQFLYYFGNNPADILLFSRLPFLVLMILFGLYIYYFCQKYFNPSVALLALFFYSFSPNIIAHSRLVTTDLGMSFAILASIDFFIRFLKRDSLKNLVLFALVLSITLLVKFSAPILILSFAVVWIIYQFSYLDKYKSIRFKSVFLKIFGQSFVIISVCLAVISGVYFLNMYKMPVAKQQQLIQTVFNGDPIKKQFLLTLTDHPISRYAGYYFTGQLMVLDRVKDGNLTFLLGQFSNIGFKTYFPISYLLKEPLAFIILMGASLGYLGVQGIRFLRQLRTQTTAQKSIYYFLSQLIIHNTAVSVLVIVIICYWIISIQGNLNLGIRHILPILPLTYILVAAYISRSFRSFGVSKLLVAALLVWYSYSSVTIFPSYLSYINEIGDGPDAGYKIFTDSNIDWGQDLKRLADWTDQHNVDTIYLDYFGSGNPEYYLGSKYKPLTPESGPKTGLIAISATLLQSTKYNGKTFQKPSYYWLYNRTPYTQIGHSILIYRIIGSR